MPTFATPQPVEATIELVSGGARITASRRTDTVIEVRPRDESNEHDVRTASEARVEYKDGKLTVKVPKSIQIYFTGRVGTVDVTVELPTGSHVRARTADGEFRCVGELGNCRLKTPSGDLSIERAAAVHLSTMDGEIIVDRADGDCHVTGSGELRIGEITGTAAIKNLNGNTWVGEVTGDIHLNSAHGDITVDRAGADVVARTAHGSVRIGRVARGTAVLQSASGELEIGIREGTAAWLEVKSSAGRIRNELEATEGPEPGRETVQVRARTWDGDITIRRATA